MQNCRGYREKKSPGNYYAERKLKTFGRPRISSKNNFGKNDFNKSTKVAISAIVNRKHGFKTNTRIVDNEVTSKMTSVKDGKIFVLAWWNIFYGIPTIINRHYFQDDKSRTVGKGGLKEGRNKSANIKRNLKQTSWRIHRVLVAWNPFYPLFSLTKHDPGSCLI